jgi:cytoskeletal protein RodZ
MPTVAEQLRAAREAKKLTVQQVADATKIRTDHIRALEDGNFDCFPAPIYIRGSVKNYAATLKLDVPRLLAALDAELKGTEKFSEPPPLVEERKNLLDHLALLASRLNLRLGFVGLAMLGVLVVVIVGFFAWSHRHKTSPEPSLPPAIYQSTNSGDVLPLPKK